MLAYLGWFRLVTIRALTAERVGTESPYNRHIKGNLNTEYFQQHRTHPTHDMDKLKTRNYALNHSAPEKMVYINANAAPTTGGGAHVAQEGDRFDALIWSLGLIAGISILQCFIGALARLVWHGQPQVLTDYMYHRLHAQAIKVDLAY